MAEEYDYGQGYGRRICADDWRAGAAWFETRLIDFDVCSNQGN